MVRTARTFALAGATAAAVVYIEKPMSWFRYRVMLRAMVFAGVVEPGYYRASVARRGTHLRLPWVEKERS